MILFYNKKTGDIYGTIEGIVHRPDQMQGVIRPQTVPVEDVGVYTVSYRPLQRTVVKPVMKTFLNQETMEVEQKKVGEREVVEPNGFEMDDPLSYFFEKVVSREKKLYEHRFQVDAEGNVKGIEKIRK